MQDEFNLNIISVSVIEKTQTQVPKVIPHTSNKSLLPRLRNHHRMCFAISLRALAMLRPTTRLKVTIIDSKIDLSLLLSTLPW